MLDGVVRETLRLYPPWGEGVVRELGEPLTLASASSTHRATGSKKPGQGLRLPAGTRVWVHTYAMQRRSAVWERGKEFLPERWWAPRRRPFTAAASGGKGAAAAGQPAAVAPFDGMASCPDVCDAAPLLSPPAPAEEEARAAGGGEEAEAGPRLCAPEGFLPFGAGPRGCLGQAFAQVRRLRVDERLPCGWRTPFVCADQIVAAGVLCPSLRAGARQGVRGAAGVLLQV